jgi:hypothetical protein
MTCNRTLPIAIGAIAIAAASMSVVLAQTPAAEEAFKAGLSHEDDQRWQDMATQMQIAIKSSSTETTKKIGARLGFGGKEYVPHYFLGLALFNMGTANCVAAMDQWAISESHGVIKKLREYSRIEDGYSRCQKAGFLLPAAYGTQNKEVTTAYESALATFSKVSDLIEANRTIARQDVMDAQSVARKDLTAAQEKLVAGRNSHLAAEFADAKGLIDKANTTLRRVEPALTAAAAERSTVVGRLRTDAEQKVGEAENYLRTLEPAGASLPNELRTKRDNGQEFLNRAKKALTEAGQDQAGVSAALANSTAAVTMLKEAADGWQKLTRDTTVKRLGDAARLAYEKFPYIDNSLAVIDRLVQERPAALKPETLAEREAVLEELKSLRRRLNNAQRDEQVARIEQIDRELTLVLGRLDVLMQSFGPVTLRDRGVVAALEDGVRQFFTGQYQQTIAALDPIVDNGGGALQIHVHLFRAASQFALYVRGGERDAALRQRAVGEVERAKQLDPAFIPDPTRFSPRFIAFYRQPNPPAATAKATAP